MDEAYILVDVETSGPNPSTYSLLSIGACTLNQPRQKFYVEIRPDKDNFTIEALQISGFTFDDLKTQGLNPKQAMEEFAAWIEDVTLEGTQPIFTAFNASFDWMFVCDYFYRYLGKNPFGYKALDIKAYFMGWSGEEWSNTSFNQVHRYLGEKRTLSHHALEDAIDAAEVFKKMLDQRAMKNL